MMMIMYFVAVDHVPPAHRQVASSQFVTAGALGLAFGPLLSSLVTRSAVHFEWWIDFQAVTAPGWIMASLWLLALLATLLVFEEPDQKVRERIVTPSFHCSMMMMSMSLTVEVSYI